MTVSFLLNVEHIRITTSFTHGNVLRIEPPLIADEALCDQLIDALRRLLETLQRGDAGCLVGHLMDGTPARTADQFSPRTRQLPAGALPRRTSAPRENARDSPSFCIP